MVMKQVTEQFFDRCKRERGVFLNQVQEKAVKQTEGPLLLLASPGSGKTTTIIMRIGYLIEVKRVKPSRIKAVTFSRASANDMKERFKRFFPHLEPVDFSTIHSMAFEVMREHFWKKGIAYQIIEGELEAEEAEQEKTEGIAGIKEIAGTAVPDQLPLHKKIILRNLFRSMTSENMTDDQMEELLTYISYIKNKMIPPDKWSLVKVDVPEAPRILQEYESFKRTGHSKLLVDFDDMLTIANDVMERDHGLLRKYQQRFDYVLTDESQDTSVVQHAIMEKLVQRHRNLCVVADDDQSIYSWRGAEPSYLLNFKQVYPNATLLFMEQNYRSSRDIVDVANQFIKRNKNRYDKNMFTKNPASRPIKIRSLSDYIYQAKYLVKEIQKVDNLSEVAVLYRNNSASIALMNEFDRAGIPFYMKDADNRFFSHWVVEDILNFMRMTYTDRRVDILERIHLKFNGYISKQQMAALRQIQNGESVFDNLLQFVPLQNYQVKLIAESKDTFQKMNGMPPLQAIRVIRGRLGYEKALEKMCERLGFRKEYLLGILNTLEEIAAGLETMEDFANRLNYLETLLKKAKHRKGQNVVTFSTFHSAKGLEFERVYMIDLVNGIIPSSDDLKADSEDLLEESVRLFYVGMTRAKKHLEMVVYNNRDGKETSESQFVTDVRNILNPPEDDESMSAVGKGSTTKGAVRKSAFSNVHSERVSRTGSGVKLERAVKLPPNPNAIRSKMELTSGKPVLHRFFGEGTIVRTEADRVFVRFEAGEKALSIDACLEMGLLEAM